MKKFYSLVLMAAALLIGTNVWANYPATWLQDQFDAIEADGQTHTITMEDDIILTDPVYLGTKTVDEPRKSIILDMNGHHITMSATDWVTSKGNVYCSMFTITHGELLVRNGDKTKTSLIQMIGKGFDYFNTKNERQLAQYNNIFNVAGSYKSSRWQKSGNDYVRNESEAKNTRNEGWFTHLEIGEGVKLVAGSEIYGAGISMDGYYTNYHAMVSADNTATTGVFGSSGLNGSAVNVCLYNRPNDAPAYNTAMLAKASEGVAYGLRVDVYGDIEFAIAATEGKAYGIKLNGGLKSSLKENEIFMNQYCWNMDEAYAKTYGATAAPVAKQGNTPAQNQTYTIVDPYYTDHELDTIDAPFLYVHSSAHISAASNLNEATAVYCSGYGKTLIEGECKGNSGVNIKSGTVELHDAVITGTATTYSNAQAGNHATGSGGIVVNSVDDRAGGVEVVISGDTKVSTTVGYAIEEVVNTKNGHIDVSSIAIQGGTIEGGNMGAIALTTSGGAATEVTGGNFNGGATVDGNPVDVGTLVPNTGGYHTTEVVVDNKTVIVVSQGDAPAPKTLAEAIADYNAWVAAGKQEADSISVKLTGAISEVNGRLEANYEFKELELNATDAQILTVAAGYTFKVGRVVLGENAQIIVEPGATFIVYGSQGIVAPVTSNILLKASEAAQATFLFNPAVTSNRHPKAKVEYRSNSFYSDHNVQQFFGLPTYNGTVTNIETTSDAKIYFDLWRNPSWDYIGAINVPGEPNVMANLNKFNLPFGLVCITSKNDAAHKPVFTFSGDLTGNMDHTFTLQQGWTSMANAYMGPIDKNAIIAQLAAWNASYGTEQSVYTYDLNATTGAISWHARSKYSKPLPNTGLNAMAPIMFHNGSKVEGVVLDYSTLVWDPYVNSLSNPAPKRREASNITKVQINIAGENEADYTTIVADSELGDDKSFCAPKYDNAGLQLYVMGNEKFDIYAADEIENSYIGYRTVNAGMYTISFEDVQGEDLVLVDLVNGNRTNIAEGAIYTFSADANEANDYRFQVVAAAKMPTSIDETEADASTKKAGVYTLTGQYLGNASIFNALPAGVYVVDGEKKVK